MAASEASTVDTEAGTASASSTRVLRFIASERAPTKAPNSNCGIWRQATTAVAASAEPVTS